MEARNAARRFTSMTESHCATVRSWGWARTAIPELLTKMSRRPMWSMVSVTIRCTAGSLVTSTVIPWASTPSARMSSNAWAVFSTLRAAMTMLAPALARPIAIPRPRPPLPPVTTATLPVRSKRFWVAILIVPELGYYTLPEHSQGFFHLLRINLTHVRV